MRIIFYSLNYAPELTGIGKYNHEMAEWLVHRGHDVCVVTAPPYYPHWKIHNGYRAWLYRSESINRVKIIRCPAWIPRKPTGLKRIIHLASFAIFSFPALLFQSLGRPQVIVSIEPPLFAAPGALFVSWISNSRSWLHIQDFEIDAAFDLGLLRSPNLRRTAMKLEKWLMSRFTKVSTISENMVKKLAEKGIDSKKAALFPNWVDVDSIYPTPGFNSLKQEIGLAEDQVIFLYSGNLGEKQGLEIIIEAARLLDSDVRIHFLICGEGGAREQLREAATGLSNLTWIPLQPLERLNELLNTADVHLLPQRENVSDLVMPSKLTGMMASGKPILATVENHSQIAKQLVGAGIISPPGDLSAFVHSIQLLASDENKRNLLGTNARSYAVNHLSKTAILSNIENALAELVEVET